MNGLILVFFVAVSCVRIAKKLYFFNVDFLLSYERHIVCADAFPVIQKLVPDKSLLPFLFIDFVFALDLSHLSPSPFSYTTYHNAFLLYHLFLVLHILLHFIISCADNRLVVSKEKRHHMLSRQAHSTVAFFLLSYQKGL